MMKQASFPRHCILSGRDPWFEETRRSDPIRSVVTQEIGNTAHEVKWSLRIRHAQQFAQLHPVPRYSASLTRATSHHYEAFVRLCVHSDQQSRQEFTRIHPSMALTTLCMTQVPAAVRSGPLHLSQIRSSSASRAAFFTTRRPSLRKVTRPLVLLLLSYHSMIALLMIVTSSRWRGMWIHDAARGSTGRQCACAPQPTASHRL